MMLLPNVTQRRFDNGSICLGQNDSTTAGWGWGGHPRWRRGPSIPARARLDMRRVDRGFRARLGRETDR